MGEGIRPRVGAAFREKMGGEERGLCGLCGRVNIRNINYIRNIGYIRRREKRRRGKRRRGKREWREAARGRGAGYFSRMKREMGVPWKSQWSRIWFSRKRR